MYDGPSSEKQALGIQAPARVGPSAPVSPHTYCQVPLLAPTACSLARRMPAHTTAAVRQQHTLAHKSSREQRARRQSLSAAVMHGCACPWLLDKLTHPNSTQHKRRCLVLSFRDASALPGHVLQAINCHWQVHFKEECFLRQSNDRTKPQNNVLPATTQSLQSTCTQVSAHTQVGST